MKNRKLIYVLIPLTILVWGGVIYRIMGPTPPDLEAEPILSSPLPQPTLKLDSFDLIGEYRDPFLSGQPRKRRSITAADQTVKAPQPPPKPKPEAPWPDVQFMGTINNLDASTRLAMLNINGKMNILGKGDSVEEIEVKQVWRDSVLVAFAKKEQLLR